MTGCSTLPFCAVRVRVPATTANLGPAFDILGLALDMWIDAKVEVAEKFEIVMTGRGADNASLATEDNMIVRCVRRALALCNDADAETRPLRLTVHSDVPMGCGCGSSSAAAVAGIMAGFALAGSASAEKSSEILRLATEIEGHPDNAAPAIEGGLQLVYAASAGTGPRTMRLPVPQKLSIVLFVPARAMKLSTTQMRGLIPTQVSMADAVHNMGRTALFVACMTTGDLSRLGDCSDDRFHQPQRASVYPHVGPCMEAARAAGAVYSFLSGAGPCVAAFVDVADVLQTVATAMEKAAAGAGVDGECIVTRVACEGASVVETTAVAASALGL